MIRTSKIRMEFSLRSSDEKSKQCHDLISDNQMKQRCRSYASFSISGMLPFSLYLEISLIFLLVFIYSRILIIVTKTPARAEKINLYQRHALAQKGDLFIL
jgi:hypothetical protein